MRQWYESLFANYAHQYDKEVFTKGTAGEVDFLESEIGFDRSSRILDIGCGTGRHSVELARRGYRVTAVDLSESMLARAREKAREAGVEVEFARADARSLPFSNEFDLALMLCEGAFPLMETDDMNCMILQSAARSLRDGGKLVLTTLNGLFPLFHSVKDVVNSGEGGARSSGISFNLMTFRETSTLSFVDDDGQSRTIQCNERYYVPPEISWLMRSAGFTEVDLYGCKIGAFSRKETLTTEDFEMLVVARK